MKNKSFFSANKVFLGYLNKNFTDCFLKITTQIRLSRKLYVLINKAFYSFMLSFVTCFNVCMF